MIEKGMRVPELEADAQPESRLSITRALSR